MRPFAAPAGSIADELTSRYPHAKFTIEQGAGFYDDDPADLQAVAAAAAGHGLVLVFAGEPSSLSGEAASRSDLRLPGRQEELIRTVAATGVPFVVVLVNGRPLVTSGWIDVAPAVLEAWHLGTEAPAAIVDVLTGAAEPAGRLPMSFPRSAGQVPVYYAHENTGRPATTGETMRHETVDIGLAGPGNVADRYTSKYLDLELGPQFEFGHGSGYTTFRYANARLSAGRLPLPALADGEQLEVSVDVTNTGQRDGDEVVQLYMRDLVSSVAQPVRRLVAFTRRHIAAGQTIKVRFQLGTEELGFWDVEADPARFIVEPGTFGLYIGSPLCATHELTFEVSLRRFGDSLAAWAGLSAGAFGFGGWEQALRTAIEVMAAPSRSGASGSVPALLVLDEFPYLAQEAPGLPSIVQSLYDSLGPGAGASTASFRLLLCGSGISVMADLLSGTRALRGRAALELRVRSFGYRDARGYWGIQGPAAAFAHNALLGGTPGYRELVLDPQVPEDPAQLGSWLARNVLRPSMPLFDEARRVVHEDPRIRDTAAYNSVLVAVAAGESSPTKIGGLLGRPATSLAHQLTTLASAGFIHRRHDLLLDRRPVITVADPMVRFHQLVIEPYLADLEAGRARQVWADAAHTVESKIFGPHLEALAAAWVALCAPGEAGLAIGPVGQTVIACREHKIGHEIDVLALERGSRPRTPGAPVAFIGQAKHRDRRPGLAELRRLLHLRDLLTSAGHDAADATLGLFSATGFTDELAVEAAASRGKILLVTMGDLYGQPS